MRVPGIDWSMLAFHSVKLILWGEDGFQTDPRRRTTGPRRRTHTRDIVVARISTYRLFISPRGDTIRAYIEWGATFPHRDICRGVLQAQVNTLWIRSMLSLTSRPLWVWTPPDGPREAILDFLQEQTIHLYSLELLQCCYQILFIVRALPIKKIFPNGFDRTNAMPIKLTWLTTIAKGSMQ